MAVAEVALAEMENTHGNSRLKNLLKNKNLECYGTNAVFRD